MFTIPVYNSTTEIKQLKFHHEAAKYCTEVAACHDGSV